MTLPRFTSGNIGRLGFANVNEICEVTDKAKEFLKSHKAPSGEDVARRQIWAILLGYAPQPAVTGAVMFVEAELIRFAGSLPHWVPRWQPKEVGGIRSGNLVDESGEPNPLFSPCFFVQANLIQQNYRYGLPFGVARLQYEHSVEGMAAWFVVAQEQRTQTFPARITYSTAISGGESQRWSYRWVEVRRAQNPPTATVMEDFPEQFVGGQAPTHPLSIDLGEAINGAEFTIGYPSVPPTTVLQRQRIPVGDIVQMCIDDSGKPFFCKPNSYSVTCA